MIDSPAAPWIIAIHTNMYAGNFEREMSGYVSGIWDNETHGGKEAAIFLEEVPEDVAQTLIDKACFLPNENNNHFMPCSIWPTPGRRNAGNGACFDEGDPRLNGSGYHAYESVAIFLEQEPTEAEIDLIWRRVKAFETFAGETARHWKTEGLKVSSLEVIQRKVTITVDDTRVATRS